MLIKHEVLNDVLFVLNAADSQGWPDPNRTNFQKILFFCSVLAPLAQIDWDYSFTNAAYGPFNGDIHQAADLLKLHGFAEVPDLTVQRDAKLRASYRITSQGKIEVERICRLYREKQRLDWIDLIMRVLRIYGPKMVTKLAYKEPTFSQVRQQNRKAIDLSIEQNRSIELISDLSEALHSKYSLDMDTLTSQLIVYFDFLSTDIAIGDSL